MIEQTARVVREEGDFVWFEADRQGGCGACEVNHGCGTGALAKVLGRKPLEMRALNTVGARSGDIVVVGVREDALVRGSLAVYLVPLLTMMGGGVLGQSLAPRLDMGSPETSGLLFAVGGLVGGFLWLRRFSGGIARDDRYQPRTLRRLGQQGAAVVHFVKAHDRGLGER